MAVENRYLKEIYFYYKQIVEDNKLEYAIFGHAGNNHFHVNILPKSGIELKLAKSIYLEIARKVVSLGGAVASEHGIGKLKRDFLQVQYQEEIISQMKSVKLFFDPSNLLIEEYFSMNFKLNASFVLISSSLLLWCASAYITQTTMAYRETSKPPEEVNQIAAMSEQVKSNPNDLDLHLKLAKTLQSDGYKSSNVNTLMQALEEYKKVLEIQSDNPEALLGIADICMDSGIPDKAAEYYENISIQKKTILQ